MVHPWFRNRLLIALLLSGSVLLGGLGLLRHRAAKNAEPFPAAHALNAANGDVGNSDLNSLRKTTPAPWLLAQSLPLKGPSGHLGRQFSMGIDAALRDVNARGGIAGRPVKIWRLDDGYEPDASLRNTRLFVKEPEVLALFGYFGTPTTHASLPTATAAGLTVVAPLTGASSLRAPAKSELLHFRASYAEEAQRIIKHLVNDGFVRIAVAYQNDAYGKDVLASTTEALERFGLTAIGTAPLPRNSIDTLEASKQLAAVNPDALVVISVSKTMASLVNNLHRMGSRPQLMTISPTGTKALFEDLPQAAAYGVGVTQVVPFPWDGRHPDVADYQRLLRRQQADTDFNFISLEGFMAARWLVKAMQNIAPDITRDRLVAELKRTGPIQEGQPNSIDLVFLGSDPWEP